MAYRFSLYDQDDPFEGLGTQQPTAAAQPQQQRDTELDAAWRERELQELDASRGTEYGFGEGVRDVLPALLALGVDAAFNKGRGAGGILQGTANVAMQGEATRDARWRASGEQALKIHQRDKGYVDPNYRWAALDSRNRGQLAVQGRHEENVQRQDDPNSQKNATAEALAYKKALAGQQGKQEGLHEYAPTRAEDEGLIAGAKATEGTNATTDALRGNPRAITAEDQERIGMERERLELARRQADTTEELRRIENEKKLREERRASGDSFMTKNKGPIDIATTAANLRRFFADQEKRGVKDMPGLGPWDSWVDERWPQSLGGPSEDDLYVRQQMATFRNPGAKELFGASLTASEAPMAEAEFGRLRGGDARAQRMAIDNLYDLAVKKIRSGAVGHEDVAREKLTPLQLAEILDQQQALEAGGGGGGAVEPAASALPQMRGLQAPPDAGRFAGARELPLPGANGVHPAAVAPGQVPGGMVTVRLNGQVSQVTPEEAEALQQLDQRVEVLR